MGRSELQGRHGKLLITVQLTIYAQAHTEKRFVFNDLINSYGEAHGSYGEAHGTGWTENL
jgi:hypothetical protein